MEPVNVFEAQLEYDDSPEGYRSGRAPVGEAAGGKENVVYFYEVPPGEGACPYHYEYTEEWLLMLEGEVSMRTPEGERPLKRGDLVCFPAGPSGAHKIINEGDSLARYVMFSSAREPAVAVYPDSDKIGVWPGGGADSVMLKRRDGSVPYWEGET